MQLISPAEKSLGTVNRHKESICEEDSSSEDGHSFHRYLQPSCLSSSNCTSNNNIYDELDHLCSESDTDIEYIKGDVTLVDDIDASISQPNNEAEQMLLQVVGVVRSEEVGSTDVSKICLNMIQFSFYFLVKNSFYSSLFFLLSFTENASVPESVGRSQLSRCVS